MGWLTCTADFTITLADGKPLPGSGKFRSTEVYVREDEGASRSGKCGIATFRWCAQGPRMAFENEKKA